MYNKYLSEITKFSETVSKPAYDFCEEYVVPVVNKQLEVSEKLFKAATDNIKAIGEAFNFAMEQKNKF